MIGISIKSSGTSIISRIIGTIFFGVFAAAGLFFCSLIVHQVYQDLQTYTWTKADCVILESKVVGQSTPFKVTTHYQYDWNGKQYSSDAFSRQEATFSDFGKAQRLVNQYKGDSRSTCWVNPTNPSQAILSRPSLWMALLIFFPLIFVGIGLGGMYAMWRGGKKAGSEAAKPVTEKSKPGWSPVGISLFFLVFFLAGAGMLWLMTIHPLWKIFQAKSWVQAPCTIISSEVKGHSDSDGTTYSIEIFYSYEFNGQPYQSSRYHFLTGSSSGHEGKAKVVRRYPPKTKTICYVNPGDPYEAVLERGFVAGLWIGLFSLPFLAVGIGGLIYTARKGRQSRTTPKANAAWGQEVIQFPMNHAKPEARAPKLLSPRSTRWGKLVGGILIAAFWNGIVSVFVWQMVLSWQRHRPEWFLTFFLIPFEIIGLALVGYVGYSFLAIFNPVVQLELGSSALYLGKALSLRWNIKGRASRLRNLRIDLEGREETTYRRGTSTVTDKNVFARIELANISHELQMRAGSAQVQIPADTMHSFASDNNKIIWTLHVRGDIPRWPDVQDEYKVEIRPIPLEEISKS